MIRDMQGVTPVNEFHATIYVPLEKNPLSLNGREHWRTKARHTKTWRTFAGMKAKRFPHLTHCDVTLTWYVVDGRRRDEDNLYPLLKALCDGLVDVDVTKDDTPDMMGKRCRIVRVDGPTAWMELTVDGVL